MDANELLIDFNQRIFSTHNSLPQRESDSRCSGYPDSVKNTYPFQKKTGDDSTGHIIIRTLLYLTGIQNHQEITGLSA